MPDGVIATRELLGVEIAITGYDGALARIGEMVADGRRGYLCHASAHGLVAAADDTELAAAYAGAELVLPDGMPLVWALRRMGERIGDRVYGPDLMEAACGWAAASGAGVWLYGGADPAALGQLESALAERHPGLCIAGSHSPPHRELTAGEEDELCERINADGPDVVWCGIGTPRQEKWMARLRSRLDAPVLVGVGAAFDFLAGRKPQAPRWMQRRGLEWLYRAGSEPRRLIPRYARTNPRFAWRVTRQLARRD